MRDPAVCCGWVPWGVVVAVVGGAIYYYQLPMDTPSVSTPVTKAPIVAPKIVAQPVVEKLVVEKPVVEKPVVEKSVEKPLDPETKAKIERILEIADLHLAIGRLVEPEGSNAAEAYRGVLELHPVNERALAGLQQIATNYERQARTILDKGDPGKALTIIEVGLKATRGTRH